MDETKNTKASGETKVTTPLMTPQGGAADEAPAPVNTDAPVSTDATGRTVDLPDLGGKID